MSFAGVRPFEFFAVELRAGPSPRANRSGAAMDEAEIWRTAQEMILQYGAEAQSQARARAEQLQKFDILEDAEIWRHIADAIAELDRKQPGEDEPVN